MWGEDMQPRCWAGAAGCVPGGGSAGRGRQGPAASHPRSPGPPGPEPVLGRRRMLQQCRRGRALSPVLSPAVLGLPPSSRGRSRLCPPVPVSFPSAWVCVCVPDLSPHLQTPAWHQGPPAQAGTRPAWVTSAKIQSPSEVTVTGSGGSGCRRVLWGGTVLPTASFMTAGERMGQEGTLMSPIAHLKVSPLPRGWSLCPAAVGRFYDNGKNVAPGTARLRGRTWP